MTQKPNISEKITKGQVDSVPCPWCNKPNDFRILDSEQLLDTGGEHYCDHCKHSVTVVAVREVKVVALKRNPGGGVAPEARSRVAQIQQQRRQIAQKPGLLGRLLGRG